MLYASTTTSCAALKKAISRALMASSCSPRRGSCIDMAAMQMNSATWVMTSHPRRRPRNGGM